MMMQGALWLIEGAARWIDTDLNLQEAPPLPLIMYMQSLNCLHTTSNIELA